MKNYGDLWQDNNTKGGGDTDSGRVERDCIHVDEVAKNPREQALHPRNHYFADKGENDHINLDRNRR